MAKQQLPSGPSLEELSTFCKRKGFVYPTCEIYGGLAGLYDYGHLGTLLKHHLESMWRRYFLSLHDNFHEIEASEIMHEQTFVASGHLKNFTDFVALCEKGHAERADHALERKLKKRFEGLKQEELSEHITKNDIRCLTCGARLVSVDKLNLMFPLSLGTGAGAKAFLRPETAQSPYVNFKRQFELTRKKLPMGLALIGRAYRNEISPRNFILRQRAFTQAELQIFFNASFVNEHSEYAIYEKDLLRVVSSDHRENGVQLMSVKELSKKIPRFYAVHMALVQRFYLQILGVPEHAFRLYQLNDDEKAFYNMHHFDIELYLGELGWVETGGIHYRTDHDLKGHASVSKESMEVHDDSSGSKVVPHVLELSFGIDRLVYSMLHLAYTQDKETSVLRLPPTLAPYSAAVFPLIAKGPAYDLAREVYDQLKLDTSVSFDSSGSIGRRYARQDEIGTPYCITIDEASLESGNVTIRERDSTKQIRVPVDRVHAVIQSLVRGIVSFEDAGIRVETRVKQG